MVCSRERRAFGSHGLLIAIALLAIWLAASIPIYAKLVKQFSRQGSPPGVVEQLQALAIAVVVGALILVAVIAVVGGLGWLWEKASETVSRNR